MCLTSYTKVTESIHCYSVIDSVIIRERDKATEDLKAKYIMFIIPARTV